MYTVRNSLLAGIAAVVFGASGAAFAQGADTHVMNVRLPDGGIAQIRYTGTVPPKISFGEEAAPLVAFAPLPRLATWGFGPDSPFAAMERISAEMDRQAAAMFRQADAMLARADSGQPVGVALQNLPPGSQGYSFVSTMSGNGVCSQSVQITATGDGPPKVVRHSSGNCAGMPGSAGAVSVPTFSAPASRPEVIETNARPAREVPTKPDVILTGAKGSKPYAGLVREIPAAQR